MHINYNYLYCIILFIGYKINSSVLNKKLKIALTFNIRPASEDKKKQLNSDVDNSTFSLYDDEYAEWDTSETIHAIKNALSKFHDVTLIEANEEAYLHLLKLRPDFVFNVAEGKNGLSREAQIPAILDMLNIPYTGSDPLTLSTCLDKSRTKEILSYHNIPTPNFKLVNSIGDLEELNLTYPLIVKPVQEGSSKGIFDNSKVSDPIELTALVSQMITRYNQPLLVEEYLPGKEFTAAIMGTNGNAFMMPLIEINFDSLPGKYNPIYSYEAKWVLDSIDDPLDIYECPANIDVELYKEIESTVLKTFNILNCKDWGRIDIRLDANGIPNIIEVNPLPGVLPNPKDNSCYPKAAKIAGFNYDEMIINVLNASLKRYGIDK